MAEALTFKIGADTKAFQNAMKDALKGLAGLTAGFLSIRAVVDSFNQALDMSGRLNDLSKRTGETAGNLAVLERAFTNAGSSAEKVGPAINKMQKTIQEAAEGSKEANEALSLLGLNAEELGRKLPNEQMAEIAAKINAIENPSSRAAAAMGIFGKSGGELLPLLRDFSGEMRTARDQLGSMPDILDKTAVRFDEVGDKLEAVKTKGYELAMGFYSELLPAIESVVGSLDKVDAAGFGQTIGKGFGALIGNFGKSMEAIGWMFVARIREAGNEAITWTKYGWNLIQNFFATIGSDLIPAVAKILGGHLGAQAAGFIRTIIQGLMDVAVALENIPGFEKQANSMFAALDEANNTVFEAQKKFNDAMKDGAETLIGAFEKAKAITPLIREDLLGAGEAFEKAADAAKEALPKPGEEKRGDKPAGGNSEFTAPLVISGGGGGKSKKEKEISLEDISEFGTGTQVGKAASARKAIEYKEKALMRDIRGDKEGAARAEALATANEARARGLTLNNRDIEAAEQYARDQFRKGDPRKMSQRELAEEAKKNLLEKKVGESKKAEEDKIRTGQGGGKQSDPMQAISDAVSEIKRLVGLIEPKLPQHVLA